MKTQRRTAVGPDDRVMMLAQLGTVLSCLLTLARSAYTSPRSGFATRVNCAQAFVHFGNNKASMSSLT